MAGVALGIHLMAPFVGESVAYIEALRPDGVTWATAITGAVLVGETQDALWYLELIRGAVDMTAIRTDIMFGRAIAMRAKAA